MRGARAGCWISVDGVEAAGKTTLVDALRASVPDAVVVNEFTDEPVGRFLREIVKEHPHVFSESRVGQSLLFLGEFWQRYDLVIRPALEAGATVLSDRGYLSKYVYQHVVMEPAIGLATQPLLSAVMEPMVAPAISVVLRAPSDVLKRRLLARGEACNDERLRFIVTADEMFAKAAIAAGKVLSFDTSRRSAGDIASSVLASI